MAEGVALLSVCPTPPPSRPPTFFHILLKSLYLSKSDLKEGRKEGRKERRKEGKKEKMKEGKKERRKEEI